MTRLPEGKEELLEFLEREAGDYFRGLAKYNSEQAEVVYTRGDLSEQSMAGRVEELYRAIRPEKEFDAIEQLGHPSATIQMRPQAVIINFPVGEHSGYIVGLEPEAARNLNEFITQCLEIIQQVEQ